MSKTAPPYLTDIAFSNAVKAMQERLGSREQMGRLEQSGRWQREIDENLADFITRRTSFYFGTASATGRPYIQHRGGPAGFISMPDQRHLEFPDYRGNRQYISLGNLSENSQAHIFMMDYLNKTRIKFWGRAKLIIKSNNDRFIRFKIEAWDVNCKQYIPDMAEIETFRQALIELQARNKALEHELSALKARPE